MKLARSTIVDETQWAVVGLWRLLIGRPDCAHWFDFSQRGLAGSFIPLIGASVALVMFLGIGDIHARYGINGAAVLFAIGGLMTLRYGALRLLLPAFQALHAFRPMMVASNWVHAICLILMLAAALIMAPAGAFFLGAQAANMLVSVILTIWGAIAIAGVVMEINIYRAIIGLRAVEIVLVIGAQMAAFSIGIQVLASMPFQG